MSQVGQSEAAIRHAAVAISSLFEHSEDIQHNPSSSLKGQFAINHYNMALKQLRSSYQDETVVIFACILFICIEVLQNNKDAAIDHCRHGVMILNASTSRSNWAKAHLLPLFLRLSIFPFFFGRTADTFPCLGDVSADMPPSFAGLEDCRLSLDSLLSRSMRFIRSVDHHRLGISNGITAPPSVFLVQSSLLASLQAWRQGFDLLGLAQQQSSDMTADVLILQMKYLVTKIWLDVCLDPTEMGYDRHTAGFQELVNLAQDILASKPAKIDPPRRPKFIFEMGFLPLMYFVVIRCRVLGIRITALRTMMALSARRENLFDSRLMRGIGRRVIELEHNIKVGQPGLVFDDLSMPPDEMRIREAAVTADIDTRLNEHGQSMVYKRVCFLGWAPVGGVEPVDEWVQMTINSHSEADLETAASI